MGHRVLRRRQRRRRRLDGGCRQHLRQRARGRPILTFAEQNLLYQNAGNGSFVDVSDTAGPALADVQVSRGLAVADFDGDGGLDFVVGNNGGTLQIGRNATPGRGNWVGLWLEGHNGQPQRGRRAGCGRGRRHGAAAASEGCRQLRVALRSTARARTSARLRISAA
ncbi:MAG: VCBS repeat-containing protein [Ardenticatenales bacterium]|nr:VCBS repeat-containing protein [Ardenticatenales bacterium]